MQLFFYVCTGKRPVTIRGVLGSSPSGTTESCSNAALFLCVYRKETSHNKRGVCLEALLLVPSQLSQSYFVLMDFSSLIDMLFYIMYVPATRYRHGKVENAIMAFCFNVCVCSLVPICFILSLITRSSSLAAYVTAIVLLFAGAGWLFVFMFRRLKRRYTYQKTVELETKYRPILGEAVVKTIYWLTAIISIPILFSIPFILLTGSFPHLHMSR